MFVGGTCKQEENIAKRNCNVANRWIFSMFGDHSEIQNFFRVAENLQDIHQRMIIKKVKIDIKTALSWYKINWLRQSECKKVRLMCHRQCVWQNVLVFIFFSCLLQFFS